ncbi:MAG: hypothetical protein ABJG78_12070 [Cyclobacteriaceae bacterium]
MKKLSLIFLFPLLFACSKDDNDDVVLFNEIIVNGESFIPTNGLIRDLGIGDNFGVKGDSHYLYDIYISDGELSPDGDGIDFADNTTFIFSFAAWSLGTDGFHEGTYEFELSPSQNPSKNYFGLGEFHDFGGAALQPVDGTLTVSKDGAKLVFDFDVTLQDDVSLTGNYSLGFEVVKL